MRDRDTERDRETHRQTAPEFIYQVIESQYHSDRKGSRLTVCVSSLFGIVLLFEKPQTGNNLLIKNIMYENINIPK